MPLKKQDIFKDFRIKDCIWSQKQFWNCCYGRGHIVCTVQWNKLFKRELFEKVRYLKGKVREDEFMIHQIVAQFEIKTVDISYEKSISLYFPLTIVIIYQTASKDRTERDSNNGYYTKIW